MLSFQVDPSDHRNGLRLSFRLYGRLLSEVDRLQKSQDATSTERRILIELGYAAGTTLAVLGASLGIERSQLSRSLKALIERDLVTTEPHPGHASQHRHSLTAQGLRLAERLDAEWAEAIQKLVGTLSNSELQHFMRSAGDALVGPGRANVSRRPDYRPLGAISLGWMIEQAGNLGGEGMRKTVSSIAAYLEYGESKLGIAGFAYERAVGTCMLVVEEDMLCRVAGFYFDRQLEDEDARQLLDLCIRQAEEMTMLRVTAYAAVTDKRRDALFKAVGFKRQGKDIHADFDGTTLSYEYHRTLKLYQGGY